MEIKYWKVTVALGKNGDHRINLRVQDESGKLIRGADLPVTRSTVMQVVTALESMVGDKYAPTEIQRAHELAWHAARQVDQLSHMEGQE